MPEKTRASSLEVAVVRLKEECAEAFDGLQQKAHRDLATMDGFVTSLPLRGRNEPTLRADLVLWASAESAQKAAEAIGNDPRFATFMASMQEIQHFAHYAGADERTLERLAGAPIVEVAAWVSKDPAESAPLQREVHRTLVDVDGAQPALAGTRDDGEPGFVDLIGWRDEQAHGDAPGVLMAKRPDLAPFFSSMESTPVFALFEVVL